MYVAALREEKNCLSKVTNRYAASFDAPLAPKFNQKSGIGMPVLFSLTFHKSCNKLNYFTIAESNEYRWGGRKRRRILNDKRCGVRADNRLVSKVEFIHAYNESCRLQLLSLRAIA